MYHAKNAIFIYLIILLMRHLEQLKQKMMVKPKVKEREKVAVVIKGDDIPEQFQDNQDEQNEILNTPLQISTKEEPDESIVKHVKNTSKDDDIHLFQETDQELEEKKKRENQEKDEVEIIEKSKLNVKIRPIIVDNTKQGFDMDAFFKKMADHNHLKVTRKDQSQKDKPQKEEILSIEPPPIQPPPKAKKITNGTKPMFIIEEEEDEEDEPNEQKREKKDIVLETKTDAIPIIAPKPRRRKTEKVEKGIAKLGPEVMVEIGDTELNERLPRKSPPIQIKVSSYMMNNREIFVNFINSLFQPYKKELDDNTESISCDNIGKSGSGTDFSLLTHQKIVRDYMNLYTPYRGLLLYHGLGSGKTCTSIAIAEGMKDSKRIIVMTPASLVSNYVGELKKCGDLLYKKNQFWEWISIRDNPEALTPMSAVLNLPQEYIEKQEGAFFINIQKKSNYDQLSDTNKKRLEEQLNEMIRQKYQFINYNGLRDKKLEQLTNKYTKNIFDNSVVIIDEAHNFISRIVNKLKKEKPIEEDRRGEKERLPVHLSTKLYEMLLSAKNARIILLSGTPVINYPNEFAILFNILRGYIKTWKIPLAVQTSKKIDRNSLHTLLMGEKTMDYLDYSPSSKILTITRNPFGFKNKIKKDTGYQGVSNNKKNEKGDTEMIDDFISDDEFEKKIISILRKNNIEVLTDGIEIKYRKALPDKFDEFVLRYVNESDKSLKNTDALKRRIIGLSSYFRSAQESLLPKFDKQLGKDYHIVNVPMSDTQFKIYEAARVEERKVEKSRSVTMKDDFEEKTSTYRIFSRLFCNYVIPNREVPIREKKKINDANELGKEGNEGNIVDALKQGKKVETQQDLQNEQAGEIEGDEVLNNIGGVTYMERLQNQIQQMADNPDDYFHPEALEIYSPKFLHILENIQDPEYQGLHLVYSQFRTAEGIGLFTLVLDNNGFTKFKIKKNNLGMWVIDIPEKDAGKPTYALYTGTETVEEKEIVRKIYNGEWDDIPDSISQELKSKYRNNHMGEVIKVFMITSSGSEGINLRNTRYVHLMDPYWHPVRSEQVIGRARRICSHKDLPPALQTVEVFVYLMVFTEAQLKSDEAIELKKKDLSKSVPKVPLTSDQYLFEISEIKAKLVKQLTDAIKETAFDCYLYSNGKCVNFGDPNSGTFSYVPDYAEQQNDSTVQANKITIEWRGKPITINGVEYVYRRMSPTLLNIYDKKTYENALNDPTIVPLQIGTVETNKKGERVFKQLVN